VSLLPNAGLLAFVEHVFPILLVVGLASRFAALARWTGAFSVDHPITRRYAR